MEEAAQVRAARRAHSGFGALFLGHDSAGFWRRISMYMSLGSAGLIALFFMAFRGWSPPQGMESDITFYLSIVLQVYLGVQVLILGFTSSSQRRGEIIVDALTSLIPAGIILYVLMLHWQGHAEMSFEQVRYAKLVASTMTIDFIADMVVGFLAVSRTMNVG